MDTAVARRSTRRSIARLFASAGFVLLIVGVTYFAILVYTVHYGDAAQRSAAFIELGDFLSGQGAWYEDAHSYGGGALLLALLSLFFGIHPMARITLPVAGASFLFLQIYGDHLREIITRWAQAGG